MIGPFLHSPGIFPNLPCLQSGCQGHWLCLSAALDVSFLISQLYRGWFISKNHWLFPHPLMVLPLECFLWSQMSEQRGHWFPHVSYMYILMVWLETFPFNCLISHLPCQNQHKTQKTWRFEEKKPKTRQQKPNKQKKTRKQTNKKNYNSYILVYNSRYFHLHSRLFLKFSSFCPIFPYLFYFDVKNITAGLKSILNWVKSWQNSSLPVTQPEKISLN